MDTNAEIKEISFDCLLSIWWSYLWRAVIFGAVAGAIVGGVFGILIGLVGRPELGGDIGGLTGGIAGFLVSIWAMHLALSKKHKGYFIRLVKYEST